MSEQEVAQTKHEILRKHSFYQKSYTGPESISPTRSLSPLAQGRVKNRSKSQASATKSVTLPKKKTRAKSLDYSKMPSSFNSPYEKLDYRRNSRAERSRPWTEKSPEAPKNKYGVRIFYEKALLSDVDESKVTLNARKYVANSKYGNIYRIQQKQPKKKEKATPAQKWLWEDEYLIWLNGTREKFLEDTTKRVKPVKVGFVGINGDMTSQSSRLSTLVEVG